MKNQIEAYKLGKKDFLAGKPEVSPYSDTTEYMLYDSWTMGYRVEKHSAITPEEQVEIAKLKESISKKLKNFHKRKKNIGKNIPIHTD